MSNKLSFNEAINTIESIMQEADFAGEGSDSILGTCKNHEEIAESSMNLAEALKVAKEDILSSVDIKGLNKYNIDILFNFEA